MRKAFNQRYSAISLYEGMVVKTFIFATSLACASIQAFAEMPIPEGITPITTPLVLRYQPHHTARCVEKKSEKALGEFFSKNSTETTSAEIFSDGGSTKVGLNMDLEGGNFVRFVFTLNEDGTGVVSGEPDFQTNLKLSEKDQNDIGQVKLIFSKVMGRAFEIGVMGKPITQGYQLAQDICSVFGATTLNAKGESFAIGTSQIRGRKAVIFKLDISATCKFNDEELSFRTTGWSSYDVESGLAIDSKGEGEIVVLGKKGSFTTDKECTVTGALATSAPAERKTDQRLTELKNLLNKGLISKEEYDQKRSSILDSI